MSRVDTLRPSQEIFSHVGMFPGLNQYRIEHNMSCTRAQHGASRETQTNDPFIASRSLPLVGSTGIIQLFVQCIATWYAMSRSHVKLTEIGTSCGRD